MTLYTRTGDDGTTGLFGGPRVRKDDPRVEAFGTVDEFNASLGLAIAMCNAASAFESALAERLRGLQSRLFDLGADLATPMDSQHASKIARIELEHAAQIEQWIDEVEASNEPMRNFVLPGGTELAARLHVARAVCRRAERCTIQLAASQSINPLTIILMNRVSDLLFALARRVNREAGVADVPWIP